MISGRGGVSLGGSGRSLQVSRRRARLRVDSIDFFLGGGVDFLGGAVHFVTFAAVVSALPDS